MPNGRGRNRHRRGRHRRCAVGAPGGTVTARQRPRAVEVGRARVDNGATLRVRGRAVPTASRNHSRTFRRPRPASTGLTNGGSTRSTSPPRATAAPVRHRPQPLRSPWGAHDSDRRLGGSGNGVATLHWTTPANNGDSISKYVITAVPRRSGEPTHTSPTAATSLTVVALTMARCTPSKFAATNTRVEPDRSRRPPPRSPWCAGLTGEADGHRRAPVGDDPLDHAGQQRRGDHRLRSRRTSAAWPRRPGRLKSTATSQTIGGLTTGQHYTFKVAATNSRRYRARVGVRAPSRSRSPRQNVWRVRTLQALRRHQRTGATGSRW